MMARLFLLIKRSNSKKLLGANPARKGISKDSLRKSARSQIRKGYCFRIITESDLRKRYSKLINKAVRIRSKKKIKRRR